VIFTAPISAAASRLVTLGDSTWIDFAVASPPEFDPDKTYPPLLALPPGRQDDRMVTAVLTGYWEKVGRQLGFVVVSWVAPGVMFFRRIGRGIHVFLDEI
jgi:hypothetical protein